MMTLKSFLDSTSSYYADDTILSAENPDDLQEGLDSLNSICETNFFLWEN